jgi:excisionase family DNA binding protein
MTTMSISPDSPAAQPASRPDHPAITAGQVYQHTTVTVTGAPEPYLPPDEVLRLLCISRATLYRWIQQGLPVHGRGAGRHLRFVWSEVQGWMAAR